MSHQYLFLIQLTICIWCDKYFMEIFNPANNSFSKNRENGSITRQQNNIATAASQTNQLSFNASNNLSLSSTTTTCTCNLLAVLKTVRKEGANFGREFYACSKPQDQSCGFFQWSDEQKIDFIPDVKTGPNCSCQLATVCKIVRKEGPNQGREFYACSNQDVSLKCNYFQWVDEPNRTQPVYEAISSSNCSCNILSVQRTVQKEGPNKGRQFLACSKPQSDSSRCEFFEWCDDKKTNVIFFNQAI